MNYYIMDSNSSLCFRGTREQCREWCEKRVAEFQTYGMVPPYYRLFFDSDPEPAENFGGSGVYVAVRT